MKRAAAAQIAPAGRTVRLTNLGKPFWPELGYTKRDLLQYYIDVADVLLPHLKDRAMVMKRYANGAAGDFFSMKRAPSPRPNQWYARCDDIDRPDYLHLDLDPVPDAGSDRVLETALVVHEALDGLNILNYAKTTGSRGIHV